MSEQCCPKCGGVSGYRFTMTEAHIMFGEWEGGEAAGDSGLDVTCTMPVCIDCGHRFRWATVRSIVDPSHAERTP